MMAFDENTQVSAQYEHGCYQEFSDMISYLVQEKLKQKDRPLPEGIPVLTTDAPMMNCWNKQFDDWDYEEREEQKTQFCEDFGKQIVDLTIVTNNH
jgi:hypothetical protein